MPDETLKTVERTLELLKAFGRGTPELTVAELVARMGMPRSVVVRILATLERAGFVERVAGNSRLFRVGLGACEFGALYFVGNPLLRSAEDVLHDLAERTGFTAYLGTLNGAEVVIQTLREGRTPVRFIWQAGDRLPVATTALGKAMLMHLDRVQIDAILGVGRVAGLTAGSIRTRAELDAKLALYAPKGWIPASEESFPGVFAVGAAVLDPNGAPMAGVSLSFLRDSADPDQVATTGAAVLEAARVVARRLGPSVAYSRDAFGSRLPSAQAGSRMLSASTSPVPASPKRALHPHRMHRSN
jgi:DNA-binding IclR family transcriptional regulator